MVHRRGHLPAAGLGPGARRGQRSQPDHPRGAARCARSGRRARSFRACPRCGSGRADGRSRALCGQVDRAGVAAAAGCRLPCQYRARHCRRGAAGARICGARPQRRDPGLRGAHGPGCRRRGNYHRAADHRAQAGRTGLAGERVALAVRPRGRGRRGVGLESGEPRNTSFTAMVRDARLRARRRGNSIPGGMVRIDPSRRPGGHARAGPGTRERRRRRICERIPDACRGRLVALGAQPRQVDRV